MSRLTKVTVTLAWAIVSGNAVAQPAVVLADETDKSGYSLFDPTPDTALRSFSTDRPTKANTPYTVDAGHTQYETDIVNYGLSRANGVQTRTFTIGDPVLKLGLTNQADIEVEFSGLYQTLRAKRIDDGAVVARGSGFGDVTTRLKLNLFGDDSGIAALALIPYIKAPTAASGLGNDQLEGGVIMPLSITLPDDFSVIVMTELDALKNAANADKHVNFTNLVAVSRTFGPVTGSAELFSAAGTDPGTPVVYTIDFTVSWLLTSTVQIDGGTFIGLGPNSPALVAFIGLSQRF